MYTDSIGILESYRWRLPYDESQRRFIWLRYMVWKRIDWTRSYGLTGSYDCAMVWKRTD